MAPRGPGPDVEQTTYRINKVEIEAANKQIAKVKERHANACNSASARVYQGILAGLREIVAAGPAGISNRELLNKIKGSFGRETLSIQDQNEIMHLVARFFDEIQKQGAIYEKRK